MEVSVQICILHHECGYGTAKLQKNYQAFLKTTFYRNIKKSIGNIEADKRKSNPGAPRKSKNQNERQIMRRMKKLMKDIGRFSSVEFQDHASMARTCSNLTVRRF